LKKSLTIAELARHAGIGVETVRYYQRLGLLGVPALRDRRMHRRYGDEAIAELRFVLHCKALGFSLKEIATLSQLRRSPRATCVRLHDQLRSLSSQLLAKRELLDSQLDSVLGLIEACRTPKPLAECEAFGQLQGRAAAADATTGVRSRKEGVSTQ
jgi:MerR family mercuric resistance operon transcriptional regulator